MILHDEILRCRNCGFKDTRTAVNARKFNTGRCGACNSEMEQNTPAFEVFFRLYESPFWEDGLMSIQAEEYKVLRRTPKGAWVTRLPWRQHQPAGQKPRFILNGEGKRFAHPTIELALESFKRRKESQIGHAEQAITFAKAALDIIALPGFKVDTPFHHDTLDKFHSY